jgi:Family of unknown function (DUF5362)
MNEQQNDSIFEFNLDDEGKSQLSGIAQWANINAIVSLVSLGLSVISTILVFIKASRYSPATGGLFQLFIGVGISLVVNIILLAAATNIKKGLELNDQGHFNLGIAKLATYFKVIGILVIVAMILVVLLILLFSMLGFGR